jgi:23S rRNA (pseudouridine1915-N3)-methyltransferase
VRVSILAVGRLKDAAERDLVRRYLERARASGRQLGFAGFEVVELAESRASRSPDRKAEEAAQLRAKAGESALIVLDERGPCPTSEGFAEGLARRRDGGNRGLCLLIGGADGLDPALIEDAGERIGFGRMTLPHQLVRVLVAEQLYRAMTILSGHPYHRA